MNMVLFLNFRFKLICFYTINLKKNLLPPLQCRLKQNLFLNEIKLIEYLLFVFAASSNPCVGPSPRTKIYFFLLSVCVGELLSRPKTMTFLPIPKFKIKFLVSLTAPNNLLM